MMFFFSKEKPSALALSPISRTCIYPTLVAMAFALWYVFEFSLHTNTYLITYIISVNKEHSGTLRISMFGQHLSRSYGSVNLILYGS